MRAFCLFSIFPLTVKQGGLRAEEDAGGGGVSVEFAFLVDNLCRSRRGAGADVNDVRFATETGNSDA